jgi:hypothetical protein
VKWRVSLNGALLVMSIGVATTATSQEVVAASGESSLTTLTTLRVVPERTAGFRPALFTVWRTQQNSVRSVANVVTMREAWESGAWSWNAVKRKRFMNDVADTAVLTAVSATSTTQRSGTDPARWLPASTKNVCTYIDGWVRIKSKWGLAVDVREFTAMKNVLNQQCRTAPAVTGSVPATNAFPANPTSTIPRTTTSTSATPVVVGSALALLQSVRVENEFSSGYDRSLFDHWRDVDGDGCDSRDQVLKRDSISLPQVDPISCDVIAGDWISPYDGARWSNPSDIDIDHVVALKEAWDSGAWSWSSAQRRAFANDTSDSRTLLAVTDSVNQSKSDKDPSNWLPPLQSYTCTYIGNWVAVKVRWNLSMDSSEYGRIRNLLQSTCASLDIAPIPNLPSFAGGAIATVTPPASLSPTPTSATATTTNATSAPTGQISPGSYCSPEGAIGYYTLSGDTSPTTYICSKTNAAGEPYSGGRARWRRA